MLVRDSAAGVIVFEPFDEGRNPSISGRLGLRSLRQGGYFVSDNLVTSRDTATSLVGRELLGLSLR